METRAWVGKQRPLVADRLRESLGCVGQRPLLGSSREHLIMSCISQGMGSSLGLGTTSWVFLEELRMVYDPCPTTGAGGHTRRPVSEASDWHVGPSAGVGELYLFFPLL